MDTPAFLLWALRYSCTIRGLEDGSPPDRVERQLRAARATSEAIREHRVLDDVCIAPPNGFRIQEALQLYGGYDAVRSACGGCPANALARCDPRSLAGCFGTVPLPLGSEHSLDEHVLNEPFPATTPPWYGLWMLSPYEPQHAGRIARELAKLDAPWLADRPAVELKAALAAAEELGLALHVVLYPPGQVEGRWWRLAPHCPACKAPWEEVHSRLCPVCGFRGAPAPDKKRHARGQRPYYPLDRLLGPKAAIELLARYSALRGQPAPPDPP